MAKFHALLSSSKSPPEETQRGKSENKLSGVAKGKVTCPCGCNHTFEVFIHFGRKLSDPELEARRKGGQSRRGKTEYPITEAEKVFKTRKEWTGEEFQAALQKAGMDYGRSTAYMLLRFFLGGGGV